MKIQIRFHRPWDRYPDDHYYGEPFDSELNNLIGGEDKWSSPRYIKVEEPTGSLKKVDASISLHEEGALVEFFLKFVEQLPDYIAALSAAVSAWAAVRAIRRKMPELNNSEKESGYQIKVDDIEVNISREINKEELVDLVTSLVKHRQKYSKTDSQ